MKKFTYIPKGDALKTIEEIFKDKKEYALKAEKLAKEEGFENVAIYITCIGVARIAGFKTPIEQTAHIMKYYKRTKNCNYQPRCNFKIGKEINKKMNSLKYEDNKLYNYLGVERQLFSPIYYGRDSKLGEIIISSDEEIKHEDLVLLKKSEYYRRIGE